MFSISKLTDLFLNPIIWVIILLAVGILLKKPAPKKRFILTGFITLLFFSNQAIFNFIANKYEVKNQLSDTITYDYGIVLSGMIELNKQNNNYRISRSADRIWQTIRLYNDGKIRKIIITGGEADIFGRDTIESEILGNFLIKTGLPTNDIIIEPKARNTYENAFFTKTILDTLNYNNLLLITSATHIRRAKLCFTKCGINCSTYSTDAYSNITYYEIDHILIPSSKAISLWKALIHEWIGLFYYRIKGYI